MVNLDNTLIEVPVVLRDRIASQRLHPRQPYYEVVEAALDLWDDLGGWGPGVLRLEPEPMPRSAGLERPVYDSFSSVVTLSSVVTDAPSPRPSTRIP